MSEVKTPTTNKEKLDFILDKLASMNELIELTPEIQAIVQDRKEQEIFNKRAAKIGRWILVIAGAIGTVLGTMWAVAKLIVTLGNGS